jgi:predicted transcriptional regulator
VKVNVTLTLEDEIVRKIRRLAAERDTTLTGLVRDYLTQLAQADETVDRDARNLANLERAFQSFSVNASPRAWSRSELHERR